MSEQFAAARAAWPGVEIERPIFEQYIAARAAGATTLNVTDLYLACACVHQVPGALDAFERTFMIKVPGFLSRMQPSTAFIDEVCQRLRERLLMPLRDRPPRLSEYSGRGGLSSWLRVAAVRTAIDLKRSPSERAGQVLDSHDGLMATGDSPEMQYLKQRYQADFKAAFHAGLKSLSSEQRTVMRLSLVDGVTLEQIGALYRVNKSTVFRWIANSRQQILDEARRYVEEQLGVNARDFDSLAPMVASQLDLSMSRLLSSSG